MPNPEDETPPSSLGFEEVTPQAAPQQSAVESETTQPEAEEKPEDAPINIIAEGPKADPTTAQKNQAIFDAILAARNAPPDVKPVQPPIPHVLTQTELEKEAGRRMNRHFEELKAQPRAVRRVDPPRVTFESTTPVHRPRDYVPDTKHGYVNAGPIPGKT